MLIKNNISIISTFSSGLGSSIYVCLNVRRLFFRDGGGWPQISAKRKLLVDQTIFAGQHIRYGHRNRPRTPPSANLSPKRFRPRVVSLNVHLLIKVKTETLTRFTHHTCARRRTGVARKPGRRFVSKCALMPATPPRVPISTPSCGCAAVPSPCQRPPT